MKYCEEYAALLDSFVDGELSCEEAARVRAHLKVCGGCRSYVDAALTMRDAFPDGEDADVPEDFAVRVMAAIQAESASRTEAAPRTEAVSQKRPVPWKKVLLPMAACLAIVVAVGQLPGMGGGSNGANTADTAAAAAQYQATTGESAEAETPGLPENRAEATEREATEDANQAAEEKRSMTVFAAQDGTAGDVQEAAVSDLNRQADKAAAPEAPTAFAASTQAYGRRAQVSLTAEQRERLLGDYEAEAQPDGTVCYTLTAEQFDAVAAALEDEGVQPDIQRDEEADPGLCYLVVTVA